MLTVTVPGLADQPFRLLDLPTEIRLMIYRVALCSSPIMPFSDSPQSRGKSLCLSTPLLCTSHKVHDEALGILHSDGVFFVRVCSKRIRFLSRVLYLGNAHPFMPPAWFKAIRRLQIDIFWESAVHAEDQAVELAENLRTVAQAVKENSNLRTLEISFWTPPGPTFVMSKDWIQNEAFASLKRLRAKQVTLSGNYLNDFYVKQRLQELKLIIEGNIAPDGISALERKWLDLKELVHSEGGIEPGEWAPFRSAMRAMLGENQEDFEASRDAVEACF
ncbi:hypothetical protein MMC29_002716 [Sticta canariensis]|nr:hypothetical protein [Sticta canariensis]